MCIDYSGILCDAILELRLLREKVINGNNNLSNGFLCKCKRTVLDYYITSVSNLMLSITELFQDDTIDSEDKLKLRFDNFIDYFFKTNLSIFNPDCSLNTKFVAFFRLTHNSTEHIIFDNIYELLLSNFRNNNKPDDICEECLDVLYELAENAILYLSGVRLDCNNIKCDILNSFSVDKFNTCLNCTLPNNLSSCSAKNNKFECLYLILIPYIFSHVEWIDELLKTIITYHSDYKNIKIILDYKLLDPFTWDDVNEQLYLKLKDIFNEVILTNCIHINFSDYSAGKNIKDADNINCIQN